MSHITKILFFALSLLGLPFCGSTPIPGLCFPSCGPEQVCIKGQCSPPTDGGPARDGGPAQDGGPARDGGAVWPDGGPARDGGPVQDGGAPPEGIEINLTWDTDQTDLDLHFLSGVNPMTFFDLPYDCYYVNEQPDWGAPGVENNPSLVLDDTDGRGPEIIKLPEPANGDYTVGVHHFCDPNDHFRQTSATIKIFCNKILIKELSAALKGDHKFWIVGQVNWPACSFQEAGDIVAIQQGCQ